MSGGSATSRRHLATACWKKTRAAVRRGRARRSCVAAGSHCGGAEELASPLPSSAGGQTGRTARAEGRGWRDSGPPSQHQSPPLWERREEGEKGLEFSGTTLFSDPRVVILAALKA